ncbi:hypothetical protein [Endozoicomonas sp. ALB032]|uniref:hypothetical protein n=1 Tax=Endozoicomonas sp. ALB032 TaxID=3403082 RepID=UPI003BB6AAA2
MNYGLPPTISTATGTISQPLQHRASGSDHNATKRPSAIDPKALVFNQPAQCAWEHWNRPSNIRNRQTTVFQSRFPREFQTRANARCPEAIQKQIDSAFDELIKEKNFINVERMFRRIIQNGRAVLGEFHYQSSVIGLARSLKEQTYEKLKEACYLLEELRLTGTFTEYGASTIHNLDLTLSRCEQLLGRNLHAEARLLALSNKKPNANVQTLCKPSRNYEVDICLTRQWQLLYKYELVEPLLQNLKSELTEKLRLSTFPRTIKKLSKYLHTVNISLVRLWQCKGEHKPAESLLLQMSGKPLNASEEILCTPCEHHDINLCLSRHWQIMGKHQLTEKLLLNMSNKRPDDTEDALCKPCAYHDVNLCLARHWQLMGKYKMTERLLLNMSGKHPDASVEALCKLCGNYDTDLTLVRHWQVMEKHELAERLLLNMSGKHPNASELSLCLPCGHHEIDLTLVRHWQGRSKFAWAERLLLNMTGKHPDAGEEVLCKPFGHYEIDLALVRLWQSLGKYELAERLLLNMTGKHPDNSEESLWQPSGHHDIDLALARLWQTAGKTEPAIRLLQHCYTRYRSDECESALFKLFIGQVGFMEMIAGYPKSANTLLATSIHYYALACKQISKDGAAAGKDNLNKALEFVESVIKNYPPNAGAYSQKAHCLRMMGASDQEWNKWFSRARSVDPFRVPTEKNGYWRCIEFDALDKVRASKE